MAAMNNPANAAASPRVLVVDDDSDVLASLERGLRLSGFEVATAADGAEALRSAKEARPDAIVLDINMPVLDGVSVVTALRAMGDDVPVCVLSARSSVDDRVAGWRPAPTTIWSSPSCSPSWWPGCGRCCAGVGRRPAPRRRPSRWGR